MFRRTALEEVGGFDEKSVVEDFVTSMRIHRRGWRSVYYPYVLAEGLGVEAAPYHGHPTPLEERMADAPPVWDEIVERYGLVPHDLDRIATWWHSDADLGRPLETFTSMAKSRRFGFLDYQDSEGSFLDLFERLRAERIIPELSPLRPGPGVAQSVVEQH